MAVIETIHTVVIAGAGIAGASAAETLRREGFAGRIVLVGDEPEPPYERPPLSKGYLLGTTPEEKVFPRGAEGYAALGIELRTGARVARLEAGARRLALADGEAITFDRLLIATGGVARGLTVPGADLAGIHTLRTLADARALRAGISAVGQTGGRVVVIGAGFIGSEVAAACRALGVDVTVLEVLAAPLERVLGAEMGRVYADIHREHGVDLRLGEGIAAFRGSDGHVEEVVTSRGERVPCALALVGVGMRPADEWLAGSGIALDGGVVVDAYCETTLPGVYAAGDVARWPYQPAGVAQPQLVRLEHWDNALRQAETAARNLLGKRVAYAPVPYFWSDQYDLKLQYVGYATQWDQVVTRGRPGEGPFAAFYLERGVVRAALAVNRVRDLVPLKKLVGTAPDVDALADEGVELRGLLTRAG
jgi:3-phenylpropionate/trans-cinnamate dioxygenase ferredoxin reductase component